MSVPIRSSSVIVKRASLEDCVAGGVAAALSQSRAASIFADDTLVAMTFAGRAELEAFVAGMRKNGLTAEDLETFDVDGLPAGGASWLEIERSGERQESWLRSGERGEPGQPLTVARTPYERHEVLSRSESGLHFVRERKSGIMRQLTDEELRDFDDPPPCVDCGEQFGCTHVNCAGELLLGDDEIAAVVPVEWAAFARGEGISRNDVERLRSIECADGEYRVAADSHSDMRTLELMLLLNETR